MKRLDRPRWWILLLLLSCAVLLPLAYLFTQLSGSLPSRMELREIQQARSSQILSSDGELIGSYYLENRTRVPLNQVSPWLADAVVSIEDIRYYQHNGIDRRALMRVLIRSILLQQDAGGGSTITQQLAKNLYPRVHSGLTGIVIDKIREMITARRIEQLYNKDEILELYLNTVSFGEDTYGIEAASRRFFNKPALELTLEESATLAGLLRAPGAMNPRYYPERALERRNLVLRQMLSAGMVSEEEAGQAFGLPLELDYNRVASQNGLAPHFREHLRRDLEHLLMTEPAMDGKRYNLQTDGLIIQTTLDSKLQEEARNALQRHMTNMLEEFADTSADSLLNAGFLALEPETGHVKAWVGSADYARVQYDHVKSKRQTGSAFKPVIYATAIEQGIKPCDYRRNRLSRYEAWDEWTPRNVSDEYGGHWSLQGALAHSVNTVAVELLMDTGIEETQRRAMQMGITDVPNQPSIALGTAQSSLLEMVSAYATFAASGHRVTPVWIKAVYDSEGRLLYSFENPNQNQQREQILSPETAAVMISMLSKSINEGTGRSLRDRFGIQGAIAGKTGTTQGYTDGWFIGLTPDLAFGVWTGGSTQHLRFPAHIGYASQTALPVAGYLFEALGENSEVEALPSDFHDYQQIHSYNLSCPDHREESTLDRFRNFITGEQSDEPRVVREETEDHRGFRDRIRSLFGRD